MSLSRIDVHFLKMASMVSQQDPHAIVSGKFRAGSKKHRGCIFAKGNKKLVDGVNTHLGGELYKPDTEERYVATVNAEIVALGKAIRAGIAPLAEITSYSTSCPNWFTFKVLVTAGVRRFVHYGATTSERTKHYAQELGVEIIGVG